MEHLGDRQHGGEPDEVRQGQGTHRLDGAELHRGVDVVGGGEDFPQRVGGHVAVSCRLKSPSDRGPLGSLLPRCIALSMSSAEASPSISAKQASLSIRIRIRLTMKPGKSFETTVVFPICSARALVAA